MDTYKYADFIFTCPLLVCIFLFIPCKGSLSEHFALLQTIDLLGTLNLPVSPPSFLDLHITSQRAHRSQYKFTLGTNIFCCIICATCATIFDAPARYMWFGFGFCLFAGTRVCAGAPARARGHVPLGCGRHSPPKSIPKAVWRPWAGIADPVLARRACAPSRVDASSGCSAIAPHGSERLTCPRLRSAAD